MKSEDNEFMSALKEFGMLTENGALTNATTGDPCVNYFAKCGSHRGRAQNDVDSDLNAAWSDSPLTCLRIIYYLRMVTRKTMGFVETEKVQKGQGNRDEFRKGLVWLSNHHSPTLYANLHLVPVCGVWKDLWHADLLPHLSVEKVYELVKKGIEDQYNAALIAKYLPKIRSKKKTKNDRHRSLNQWGRGFCKFMGWNEQQYRKFKSDPEHKAHLYQRSMCGNEWDSLDFNSIPGKALFSLVSQKGKDGKTALERHGLEGKYLKWIQSKPTAKFTGYVFELLVALRKERKPSLIQTHTFNKQFEGLVELAKRDEGGLTGNVWCALDTSGSMSSIVTGKVSAYDICIGLGIYFSCLNEGAFADHVIMFDNTSSILKLSGTFCERAKTIQSASTAWGSTNFESVIDLIVNLRQQKPDIPVEDFPETLLVVSDMQFNPVNGNAATNYQRAMERLAAVGLPKMRIIWWFVTSRGKDFPSTVEDEGVTMIGGFDGAIVSLILGGEKEIVDQKTGEKRLLNAYENMLKALDQELLKQLVVVDE
eukprot:CAMPEP_0174260390 /NCGR_PEP_ID=MMETSP0439-20130205/9682_1 /TAXON_ID=0 /ORGANISM="Stereomyxa ramosa, Strain Chinc5" /LENGTH=535 /DNA_ID=CAMNT_0015344623 /DNA_START=31 /DNA_END=1638 /DNA_ORIENTATION=-